MRWVVDTGPVLHLAEANALDLLRLLGDVASPPAVVEEFARLQPRTVWPPWLQVVPLDERPSAEAQDWHRTGLIHQGEAHAIALARQLGADVLLTDDTAARLFAMSLGLHVRGSLGVILWVAGQGKVEPTEAARHIDRLAKTSLWLSRRILAEAHSALREISDLRSRAGKG